MIKRVGSKWQVQSASGKPLGTYDTRDQAAERLRQVEAAKRRRRGLRMKIGSDGSIEVRHMSDTWKCGSVELNAGNAEGGSPVWIQVAKCGSFKGHPAGPFELNAAVFSEIVRNFHATENKHVPVDFEHASESEPTEGSIPTAGAPAQGWITELDNRGADGLWGLVEWGDLARQYIRSGQYRYLSPAIRFGARDRVTGANIGARLTSAALVNVPYLDGMRPLAARDTGTPAYTANEYLPKMRVAMMLPELATPMELGDTVARIRRLFDLGGQSPIATVEGVEIAKYLSPMREMMRMPLSASWDELFDAVQDMIDAAIDEHESEEHEPEPEPSDTTQQMRDTPKEAGYNGNGSTNMTDAERIAKLEVDLNKSDLERKAAEAKAGEFETQVKALRSDLAARSLSDREIRVDEVLAVYKDKKGLTKEDRPALLSLLSADATSFDKLYPPVTPAQRYLMRDLTHGGGLHDDPRSTVGKPAKQYDIVTMADKMRRKNPGMSLETSLVEADKKIRAKIAARTNA